MENNFRNSFLDKLNRLGEIELAEGTKYNFIVCYFLNLLCLSLFFSAGVIILPLVIVLSIAEYAIDLYKYILLKYRIRNKDKFIKDSLLKHQKKLLKANEYYILKGAKISQIEIDNTPLSSFIYTFLNINNSRYCTYTDKLNYICDLYRRRSVGDIFLICRYYYPKCTLEEVQIELLKLVQNGKISGSYCNTILKYVYYIGSTNQGYNNKLEFIEHFKFRDMQEVYGLESNKPESGVTIIF
jgi:hypothetical protein